MIPDRVPAVMEFRHVSWFDDAVLDCLRSRNIAICHSDDEASELPFVATADWGYLRLRRPDYDTGALREWIRIANESAFNHTYVFFKHEDDGAGPEMAMQFQTLPA